MSRLVVVGGGPAGYEAALVAAQFGAEALVVERDGFGGQCVLSDCVPSKALVAVGEAASAARRSERIGLAGPPARVRLAEVNARVSALALAQSADVGVNLERAGVELVRGSGRLLAPGRVELTTDEGARTVLADVVLLATGARPRVVPGLEPDGERVLDWRQLYGLAELPEHLVVVGSGVTGVEFAGAYLAMGSAVTLVSSRERVLPGEDVDAAELLQGVFLQNGMGVVRGRAASVERSSSGVRVDLVGGGSVEGSHCLVTVGSVPNVEGLGLEAVGVTTRPGGHVAVDKVSRTTVPGVYAAGDVTGVLPLASVAAMQGRTALWHALGEAVEPLRLSVVSSNVFTDPQVASVGVTQLDVESEGVPVRTVLLPLSTNARAKMEGLSEGFVKLFCRPGSGTVLGGVVVAPNASELVMPVGLAVQHGLTVYQLAHTFSIYPSLSGSLTEAARRLMLTGEER